jgi:hypothetical protein
MQPNQYQGFNQDLIYKQASEQKEENDYEKNFLFNKVPGISATNQAQTGLLMA